MELKQLQAKAAKRFLGNLKRDNIEASEDYLILKLTEELGEFVQSYLIHKKRCRPVKYVEVKKSKRELSKELADVLGIILVIAKTMKIDVEEALVKKWITKEWLKNK
jgi:NTP pyrophosphatase (non-canonical NTP hydrolase)